MSSFRIDRQYVSFETAETEPVHAAKPQKTKPAPNSDITTNNTSSVDVSKLYNEIYERLQREHAEQAEDMLSRAADEAHDIVAKAKKQSEEILQSAKTEAARLKDELTRELETAAAEREREAKTELLDMEAKLNSDYTELVDGMRGKIIALVMEIVKKIIGVKLSESDDIFIGMIRDALERLKQAGSVLIRVSPEDYARYFGAERDDLDLNDGDIRISAVEEPDFSQGDLIVESEGEMVDLSINRQIDMVEKAFSN